MICFIIITSSNFVNPDEIHVTSFLGEARHHTLLVNAAAVKQEFIDTMACC